MRTGRGINSNKVNTIVQLDGFFEVYYNNELVTILDDSFKYLTDRTYYNLIRKNKVTEYSMVSEALSGQEYIHRIVASTVYDLESGHDMHVNHINGSKLDNRLENLEYISGQENQNKVRGSYNEIQKEYMKNYMREYAGYKTTRKSVIQKDLLGNVINEFKSGSEAENITGFSAAGIRKACNDKSNVKINGASNQYKGFIWEKGI